MIKLLLHPEHGCNPHFCHCWNCKKHVEQEFYLLGRYNNRYICPACGQQHLGKPEKKKCHSCSLNYSSKTWESIPLKNGETIPSQSLCSECQKELKHQSELVKKGGVYFLCSRCGSSGILLAESKLAQSVREYKNTPPPEIVSYESNNCPNCCEEYQGTTQWVESLKEQQ